MFVVEAAVLVGATAHEPVKKEKVGAARFSTLKYHV
jgi:hypothetical protein